jgi:hypothetical protein
MKKLNVVLVTFVLSLLGCKDPEVPKASIDLAFSSYFNQFLEEGKKRGINFTTAQQAITMQFSELPKKYGFTGYTNYDTKTIDIIPEWIDFPTPIKERLIYHELGHLMLGRNHNNLQLSNGEYASLMWTSKDNPLKCVAPIYTSNLRKAYYFDELFNSNVSPPKWAYEEIDWKEPSKTKENTVVGINSWSNNSTWDAFVRDSPYQISYLIEQNTMRLLIGKQSVSPDTKIPLSTLFPILTETSLQNYEVRLRYKLYGRGFELDWKANNNSEKSYFLTSNSCDETAYLGVGNNEGGFFYNKKLPQDLTGTNELVLQHKDNYIMIWQNGKILFQTDIAAGTAPTPLALNLYFLPAQYDFEFITVTRL